MKYSQEVLEIAKRHGLEPAIVAEARSLSPKGFEQLIAQYLEEGEGKAAYHKLFSARDLATPYLISVLEKPNAFQSFLDATFRRETPATLMLPLLERGVNPSLKHLLRKGLKSGNTKIFSTLVRHLTYFGSDDIVEDLRELIRKEPSAGDAVRGAALEAIKSGRAEPTFKKFIWDYSIYLLGSEKPPQGNDPTRHLVALDSELAKHEFLKPSVLRADHPLLPEILSQLNKLQSPAPVGFLLHLLENENSKSPKPRRESVRRAAIFGLVRHQHPAAQSYVEEILANAFKYSDDMVLAAWHARFKIHQISSALETAYQLQEKSSLEELTPEHRGLILIEHLHIDISTNGFASWYEGKDGRYSKEVRNALELIQAMRHVEVLEKANSLFGPDGPAEDDAKRQEQLQNMVGSPMEDAMDKLDLEWDKLPFWQFYVYQWDWDRQQKG